MLLYQSKFLTQKELLLHLEFIVSGYLTALLKITSAVLPLNKLGVQMQFEFDF